MKNKFIVPALMIMVLALSMTALVPRMALERDNINTAVMADYREVVTLARNAGVDIDAALSELKSAGLRGLMVSELTADNLERGGIGLAELKQVKDVERGIEGTAVSISPYAPHKDLLNKWLRMRFGVSGDKAGPVMLTMPANLLRNTGVLPDIEGLEAAKKQGLPVYYRPGSSPGHLASRAAMMLAEVHKHYPLGVYSPAGEYVAGYPDVSMMASLALNEKVPVAMVEFSKQAGERELNAMASPYLLSLHSVTADEMTSRRISRQVLRERMTRAALERGVRLLLLRAAPVNTGDFRLTGFVEDVRKLREDLEAHGLRVSWPEAVFASHDLNAGVTAKAAMAVMLMLSLWFLLGCRRPLVMLSAAVVLALISWKSALVLRFVGMLAAPMAASAAALTALDAKRLNVLKGFALAVIGGLAVAGAFSTTSYMMRLSTFSGVRLTLILPIVIVLVHDMHKRIHPETLREFMSRPPLWGELIVIALMMAAGVFMVLRSDNVQGISGLETALRDNLERLLIARPRTKEVFVGYPAVMIALWLTKRNLLPRYRELFRLASAVGFSSVVNSFCHFHTPLWLILLREFNGLWTGLLVGAVLLLAVKAAVWCYDKI